MIVIRGKTAGSRTRLRCRYGGQARLRYRMGRKRAPRVNRGALFARYGDGVLLLDVKRDGAFLAAVVGVAWIGGGNGAVSSATAATAATTATGDHTDEHGDGE